MIIAKYYLRFDDDSGYEVSNRGILPHTFKLIEENTIDIDSIGELLTFSSFDNDNKLTIINTIIDEQNKVKRAVKQLNKEIQELKEK